MKKNILIVTFNTQKLTDACIKSVNKFIPDCKIFVFDNGDKEPFINIFDNVVVLDNTKGQIIDFNKWLEKYPNKSKSPGKVINWGSAKHAYTIEKCIELINEPFLLLDSDILLKRDTSALFDTSVCYVADVITQDKSKIKRALPYICFINTPLCKEKKVHYFNEKYMHGLYVTPKGDGYDTGAAFFISCENAGLPHKEINRDDYIVHYKSGSWTNIHDKLNKKTHIPVDEWLETYRYLWDDSVEKEIPDAEQKLSPSYSPEDGPANNNGAKPVVITRFSKTRMERMDSESEENKPVKRGPIAKLEMLKSDKRKLGVTLMKSRGYR